MYPLAKARPRWPHGVSLEGVGHVVVDEEPVEPHVVVDLHGPVHINVAGVDELLVEPGHLSGDVAEMDVEDLFALSKVADHLVDVLALHLGEGALAELDSVGVRWVYLYQALVRFKATQKLRNAT